MLGGTGRSRGWVTAWCASTRLSSCERFRRRWRESAMRCEAEARRGDSLALSSLHPIRFPMISPARVAKAMIVSWGFTAMLVGTTLPSTR